MSQHFLTFIKHSCCQANIQLSDFIISQNKKEEGSEKTRGHGQAPFWNSPCVIHSGTNSSGKSGNSELNDD
jgi:hypothetical protein